MIFYEKSFKKCVQSPDKDLPNYHKKVTIKYPNDIERIRRIAMRSWRRMPNDVWGMKGE